MRSDSVGAGLQLSYYGSSPFSHLARTRDWPNPNPNRNHNPNTLTLTLKTILARCETGLDPLITSIELELQLGLGLHCS